jgi:predicted dehydrogenase
MVGFNRRFSPHCQRMARLLQGVHEPKALVITVNAGAIPSSHWTQDPAVGGGRIVGEGCHFVDLARFLVQAPITGWDVAAAGPVGSQAMADCVSITLRFEDGSIATILYLSNGHRSFPKERIEVFAAGRILQLDNFRTLTGYGWPQFRRMKLFRQDKGQQECAARFLTAVKDQGTAPIPYAEIMEVSRVTVALAEAAR